MGVRTCLESFMDRVRVAFIGAWGHVDAVLAEIDQLPWVEVVGCAKARPDEDWEPFQRKYACAGRTKEWADYRDLLRDGKPQVAVVSTRLDLIAPLAMEAAEAGCDLICEKPLALSHRWLSELMRVVKERQSLCIAMLGYRSNPVIQAARDVVASGRIGKVVLCNARKSYKWGQRPAWFGERALYGGTIGWVGIHGLDFIHTVTAQEFTSVAAMQSNLVHTDRPACEDNCGLVLALSGGGHATLSIDYLRPAAAPTHGDDWLRVVGSEGVLEANISAGRCTVITRTSPPEDVPIRKEEGFYESFFRQIRDGNRTPPPDMHKAFYLTHVGICARDAADERRVVSIPCTG
jgi:predicted dehydrogenase